MREVHNKLGRNDRFFSEWNIDMAYVLGFITADGCIKDDYELCITIHKNDVDVLEYIKKVMNLEHNIRYTHYNNREQVTLSLKSRPIYEDLQLLNVTPRKTYTIVAPPFIPEDMFGHYIRGYFDGNGNISLYNHAKQVTGIVGMKGASEVYIRQLSDILHRYNVNSVVYTKPSKDFNHVDLYELRMNGKSIIDFAELIYCDAPFYMNRKYEKFQVLYNGRFAHCIVCGSNYYRERIDQDFCDRCRKLVRSGRSIDLESITNIPSEAIRHTLYSEHGGSTNKFKILLKMMHNEDMVRTSVRTEENTMA